MNIIKVGEDRYINVDRVTYIEPKRKGKEWHCRRILIISG